MIKAGKVSRGVEVLGARLLGSTPATHRLVPSHPEFGNGVTLGQPHEAGEANVVALVAVADEAFHVV